MSETAPDTKKTFAENIAPIVDFARNGPKEFGKHAQKAWQHGSALGLGTATVAALGIFSSLPNICTFIAVGLGGGLLVSRFVPRKAAHATLGVVAAGTAIVEALAHNPSIAVGAGLVVAGATAAYKAANIALAMHRDKNNDDDKWTYKPPERPADRQATLPDPRNDKI